MSSALEFLLLLLLLLGLPSPPGRRTETASAATSNGRSQAELNSSPIQDNSFLVEEAYNQEDGVVQHISFFQYLPSTGWAFTQTDEWPLRTIKHQLSLTTGGHACRRLFRRRLGRYLHQLSLPTRRQWRHPAGDRSARLAAAAHRKRDGRSRHGRPWPAVQPAHQLRAEQTHRQPLERGHDLGAARAGPVSSDRNVAGREPGTVDGVADQPALQCTGGNLLDEHAAGRRAGRDHAAVQPVHQPRRALGLQLQERPADCSGRWPADRRRSQHGQVGAIFYLSFEHALRFAHSKR